MPWPKVHNAQMSFDPWFLGSQVHVGAAQRHLSPYAPQPEGLADPNTTECVYPWAKVPMLYVHKDSRAS